MGNFDDSIDSLLWNAPIYLQLYTEREDKIMLEGLPVRAFFKGSNKNGVNIWTIGVEAPSEYVSFMSKNGNPGVLYVKNINKQVIYRNEEIFARLDAKNAAEMLSETER